MNEVLNKIQSILDCMHQTDWAHNPDKFVLIMRTDLFREFQEIGIRRVYHLWGFKLWFVEDDRIPEDTADGLTSSDIHIVPKRYSPISHKEIVRRQRQARKAQST